MTHLQGWVRTPFLLQRFMDMNQMTNVTFTTSLNFRRSEEICGRPWTRWKSYYNTISYFWKALQTKLLVVVLSVSTPYQVPLYPQERLAGVFVELGAEETEAVPFHLLYQHPIIQDCMHMCQRFKTIVSTLSFAQMTGQTHDRIKNTTTV